MNSAWLKHFLVAVAVSLPSFANSQTPEVKDVSKFVNKYCVSCHGSTAQEADRRFDDLSSTKLLPEQREKWHEILDRLNLGDMPPEDAKLQPTDQERIAITGVLTKLLTTADRANRKQQPVFRRLNRTEYDASIRHVLGLEEMLEDPCGFHS